MHQSAALRAPEMRARLEALGLTVVAGGPDDLTRLIEADLARWGAILRTANLAPG